MPTENMTANVLADNKAPYANDDFSAIMELTKEEKTELIFMWRNRRSNER